MGTQYIHMVRAETGRAAPFSHSDAASRTDSRQGLERVYSYFSRRLERTRVRGIPRHTPPCLHSPYLRTYLLWYLWVPAPLNPPVPQYTPATRD